jgi:predicted DsbA family dithiol-disulfide isomerase
MRIDIWSDVVCPWCSVGRARFARALEAFEHRDQVEVVWRSFELDPSAAPSTQASGGQVELLASKYGRSPAEAQQMLDQMTATAAADGLTFRFDLMRGGNTFDAHRLLHLALARGRQHELKQALDTGTFAEGLSVSDHDELTRVAVAAGLDEDEVRRVLASDEYADAVRADVAQARAYGITGVPFFVLDGRFGVSGAQPAEQVLAALEQAWGERSPVTVLAGGADAPTCDDDSCAV